MDVCGVLSGQTSQRGATLYWGKLKQRLKTEESQLLTFCQQLKMLAEDGKMRLTDVLDTKGILRLVQSIPSPKAEPFKVWLAEVGAARLDEIADPEKAILRGADFYRQKGYPDGWINQRLQLVESLGTVLGKLFATPATSEVDDKILYGSPTIKASGKFRTRTSFIAYCETCFGIWLGRFFTTRGCRKFACKIRLVVKL